MRREDKAFSNYLRNELEDEVHGLLPDIHDILDVLAHLRKPTFSLGEFRVAYLQKLKAGGITTSDPDFVAQALFHFSIIGNRPRQKTVEVFKFINKEARLNPRELIIVHRGLYKSLQIM